MSDKLRGVRVPTVCEYIGARVRFGSVVFLGRDWTYSEAGQSLIVDGVSQISVGEVQAGDVGEAWLDRGNRASVVLLDAIGEVLVLRVGRSSVWPANRDHSLRRHPLRGEPDFRSLAAAVQGVIISWPIGLEVNDADSGFVGYSQ